MISIKLNKHLTGLLIGFDGSVDELFRCTCRRGNVVTFVGCCVCCCCCCFPCDFLLSSVSELELLFSMPESDSDVPSEGAFAFSSSSRTF